MKKRQEERGKTRRILKGRDGLFKIKARDEHEAKAGYPEDQRERPLARTKAEDIYCRFPNQPEGGFENSRKDEEPPPPDSIARCASSTKDRLLVERHQLFRSASTRAPRGWTLGVPFMKEKENGCPGKTQRETEAGRVMTPSGGKSLSYHAASICQLRKKTVGLYGR